MHITANREQLRIALSLATSVADRKSTMPQLACALLRADGKRVSVAASDLSIAYVTEAECTVKEAGALAIDAKALHDIVSSLSTDEVTIRSVDGRAEVRAGKSRFQLGTRRAEDFPAMPDVSAMKFVNVDTMLFRRLMEATAPFSCQDISRQFLSGVYFDPERGEAMASDGHRAAVVRLDRLRADIRPMQIPTAAVTTILRVIDGSESFDLARNDATAAVRVGATTLVVKLLGCSFPAAEVRRMPSANALHVVTVPRETFIAALKRVSLVSTKEASHATNLKFAKDVCMLSSRGEGQGSTSLSEDEIAIGYESTGHEVRFNAAYLISVLESFYGDEATLRFESDPLAPLVARPVAEETGEEQAVMVMGMRND